MKLLKGLRLFCYLFFNLKFLLAPAELRDGFTVDFSTAQRILKEAEAGSSHSQYYAGLIYLHGTQGFSQDGNMAVHWLRKAALSDNTDAQTTLGKILLEGEVVHQDYFAAAAYLKKAARADDSTAQWLLGTMYYDGRLSNEKETLTANESERFKQAFDWFSKSAEHGNSNAQVSMGIMYEYGIGASDGVNLNKAQEMYQLAANQGNAEGMFYLGVLNLYGRGVRQNLEKGAALMLDSANLGHIPSMDTLGKLYTHGQGVPKDYKVAAAWFRKAETNAQKNSLVRNKNDYYQLLGAKSGDARQQLEKAIQESDKLMLEKVKEFYL